MSDKRVPVVFIHGAGLHFSSWQPWMDRFSEFGFDPVAPGWPGEPDTVSMARACPAAVGNVGLQQATDHFAEIIRSLPQQPIIIGHASGGLIAQKLHGEGIGRAAIAVSSAPTKGVWQVTCPQLRSALQLVGMPWVRRRTIVLTSTQFRFAVGNALSEKESNDLFERLAVPSPRLPAIESIVANFHRRSPATVNYRNSGAGPLLLIAGSRDRTASERASRADVARYKRAGSWPELVVFEGRGHSMIVDSRWGDVADRCLEWLSSNGLQPETGLGSLV